MPQTALPTWLWRGVALLGVVLTLALIIGDLFHSAPGATFGFKTDQAQHITRVTPGSAAARAGIASGDTIELAQNDFADRVAFSEDTVARGTLLLLRIDHDGRSRRVALVAREPDSGLASAASTLITVAFQAIRIVFVLVAALIIVRRPERPDARALATFLLAFAAASLERWPWYPPIFAAVLLVGRPMLATFALAQAVRFATLFPRSSERGLRRFIERTISPIAGCAILAVGATNLVGLFSVGEPGQLVSTLVGVLLTATTIMIVVSLAVAFTIGAREAEATDRPRLRWVALSIALGLGGLIPVAILEALGIEPTFLLPLILLVGAIPIGTGYAILRHRMLDIGFVVNRTLGFGAVSAVVVAVFTLLEFVIGKYVATLGHVQSFVLEALVVLAIGASLRGIHERADTFIDNVFFRDRYRAERALRRLAREAAFVSDPDVLAQRLVTAVTRHADARLAALYLRGREGGLALRCAAPEEFRSDSIAENDPAVVRARAAAEPVDLDDVAAEVAPSALPGTVAFPMIVHGELLGLLACGAKRSGENYAPDERSALAELAHAVGIAFDTIATLALHRAVDRALEEQDLEPLRRARASLRGSPAS